MYDHIYDQILYHGCLSIAFKLKLRLKLKIVVVTMTSATEKEIVEYVIRLAKICPTSGAKARYAQLLIIIYRLWKVWKTVEVRRERRMVAKRMVLVLL